MSQFDQGASLVGAALILYGYFALQRGTMSRADRAFNVINLVGSVLLTYAAVRNWNLGFVVLEGSWALLSISGALKPGSSEK